MRSKMIRCFAAIVAIAVAGCGAPPQSISDFFDEFTAEWMRANPDLAVRTRY